MGTENAIMAAVRARGTTRIANAASEPHVQGLCRMLVAMGASIGESEPTSSRSAGSKRWILYASDRT